MNLKKRIDLLREGNDGYWTLRLYSQLDFLQEMLLADPAQPREPLERVTELLLRTKKAQGILTRDDVLEAERALACYSASAKQYRLHLVSHAHIDMDWRWGWEETVGIVIDTFQTMLKLLEEYPEFIFSQSQASVYEIVERYAPELLPKIRHYIREGRWEVLASTWVEADKNLSGTEAMVRHILYTKRYLSALLDIDPDSLQIDFEPDTFGHSRNVPEVLAGGGIRYYYHCRGNDDEELYRWRAPSGAEVLVMRDPQWYYLKQTDYQICWHVPSFCARNHTSSALRFYGVGDHGGGPSRRDIERIRDMQSWPLLPTMLFSTLGAFFREAEEARTQLPVVERELNFVFTGCYTAQSRIKQANRYGEDRLYDSEALCAMAQLAGCTLTGMPSTEPAWRNVLFNQFHDILPGTCVREARERALGRSQDAAALALANAKRAMRELGERVPTDAFSCEPDPDAMAEGGGTGYGCWTGGPQRAAFSVNGPGNAGGSVRAYTVFNTTPYDRQELVELTIWDWGEPLEATAILDSDGAEYPFDILESNKTYWHHRYSTVSFPVRVPAFGYRTYYVMPADRPAARDLYFEGPRRHRQTDDAVTLENSRIRAVFRRESMELVSLTDKASGRELLHGPAASFCLIDEQSVMPYSAWTVGQAGRRENLNRSRFVRVTEESLQPLRQSITYELAFRRSTLKVTVFLAEHSPLLRFSVDVDWLEAGKEGESTPQLQFCVPYGYEAASIRYDVPGGALDRPELGHDVPAIRYACPVPAEGGSALLLTSDCKYGYRAFEGQLSLTLLRASINPDRYPEYGSCRMELGLGVAADARWSTLTEASVCFAHPMYIYSNTIHSGTLPASGSLLRLDGDADVAAVKPAENGEGIVIRMHHSGDEPSRVRITLPAMRNAQTTDLLERVQESLPTQEGTTSVELPAKALKTVWVQK